MYSDPLNTRQLHQHMINITEKHVLRLEWVVHAAGTWQEGDAGPVTDHVHAAGGSCCVVAAARHAGCCVLDSSPEQLELKLASSAWSTTEGDVWSRSSTHSSSITCKANWILWYVLVVPILIPKEPIMSLQLWNINRRCVFSLLILALAGDLVEVFSYAFSWH
jgi:hypothetical protein